MNNISIQDEINELRLIVLLESDDRKSFRQIRVTKKQFKNISDNTGDVIETDEKLRPGFKAFETYFKEDWEVDAELFQGCKSIDRI